MDCIDKKRITQLYRIDCPETAVLGEYHLHMLPAEKQKPVQQHLQTCPHCRQELAQLEIYLDTLAPEIDYTLREKIQIWVARLIPTGFDTSFAPSARPAQALRGQMSEPFQYEANGYQINLEVQDDPAQPNQKSILGLLVGDDDSFFQAQLWQNGRSLQQIPIDNLGNFVFTSVPPGTYDLILSQHTLQIHVQAFQIQA